MLYVNCKVTKIKEFPYVEVLIDLGFDIVIRKTLRLRKINESNKYPVDDLYYDYMLKNVLNNECCILMTPNELTDDGCELFLYNNDDTLFSVNDSLKDFG